MSYKPCNCGLCDDCQRDCAPHPVGWVPKHEHPDADAAYECESGIDPCQFAREFALEATGEGSDQ